MWAKIHNWRSYITHNDTAQIVGLSGWEIGPQQETLRDNTQQSREKDTHAPCRIRTRNSSKRSAAGCLASGIGSVNLIPRLKVCITVLALPYMCRYSWFDAQINNVKTPCLTLIISNFLKETHNHVMCLHKVLFNSGGQAWVEDPAPCQFPYSAFSSKYWNGLNFLSPRNSFARMVYLQTFSQLCRTTTLPTPQTGNHSPASFH
jgi:hypothetical protein